MGGSKVHKGQGRAGHDSILIFSLNNPQNSETILCELNM